jgi:hypothetical protein
MAQVVYACMCIPSLALHLMASMTPDVLMVWLADSLPSDMLRAGSKGGGLAAQAGSPKKAAP